jgi:carbamoylphosphate synthase large subunit
MKKVVILDGQTIQTLPVAKSLKRQGFYVIVLCDNKNSYGYRTRFADEKMLSPSTKDEPRKFHEFLVTTKTVGNE